MGAEGNRAALTTHSLMAEEYERDEEASASVKNDRESVAAAASLDKLTDHVIIRPANLTSDLVFSKSDV